MKIILSASIPSCIGKSSNIVEDIKNLNDVEFISKETNIKENCKSFNMTLTNDSILNSLKTTLNYFVAKYKLKDSTITIKS